MTRMILISFLLFLTAGSINAQNFREINREQLLELTEKTNDTTYVINFWATWCSPCVKEIPYFEELHQSVNGEKTKVILVSLDFPKQAAQRLTPFLEEKQVTATVKLMTDHKYNDWIDLVDSSWSGALPATLIYQGDRRVFLEKELTRDELFTAVKQISN